MDILFTHRVILNTEEKLNKHKIYIFPLNYHLKKKRKNHLTLVAYTFHHHSLIISIVWQSIIDTWLYPNNIVIVKGKQACYWQSFTSLSIGFRIKKKCDLFVCSLTDTLRLNWIVSINMTCMKCRRNASVTIYRCEIAEKVIKNWIP